MSVTQNMPNFKSDIILQIYYIYIRGHLFNFVDLNQNIRSHLFTFGDQRLNSISHLFTFGDLRLNIIGGYYFTDGPVQNCGLIFQAFLLTRPMFNHHWQD